MQLGQLLSGLFSAERNSFKPQSLFRLAYSVRIIRSCLRKIFGPGRLVTHLRVVLGIFQSLSLLHVNRECKRQSPIRPQTPDQPVQLIGLGRQSCFLPLDLFPFFSFQQGLLLLQFFLFFLHLFKHLLQLPVVGTLHLREHWQHLPILLYLLDLSIYFCDSLFQLCLICFDLSSGVFR